MFLCIVISGRIPFNEKSPSFIDNQRYSLPNGNYSIELTLKDDYDSLKKPLTIKSNFIIYYTSHELQCSSIQALEKYYKNAELY